MGLTDNIHQLSRDHLRTGPDGKAHMVPALLTELRNAVTPGNSGSSGGASGPPIPINAEAVDMLTRMEAEAKTDYYEMAGEVWAGDLSGLLQRFAGMDLAPEWDAYLARVTLGWIDDINAFLWPVKPRRKLVGIKCPSCGYATYGEERKTCLSLGCWDPDGGVLPPGNWDIKCASCDAGWSGDQIAWLLTALDTPETTVAQEAEVM